MLNITHYQRNANQNHIEVPSQAGRMAALQKSTNNKCWRGCAEENPLTLLVGMQTSTATIENNVEVPLKKLEIELPYDPEIPLQGIHTEETRIERDKCTPIFIAALFTIARAWK